MAVFLFEGIRVTTNPLIQSEERIKEKLLVQTPLGTPMDDVIRFVENKEDWVILYIDHKYGFKYQGILPSKIIGVKSIGAYLGQYRIITNLYLSTDVSVYYGFDENEELIDIWVWKTINAI